MADKAVFKKDLAQKAAEWLKYVKDKYPGEIQHCIDHSRVYNHDFKRDAAPGRKKVLLSKHDTVSELFARSSADKIAILNFASYKYPGGAFLDGSTAQEEALCHESILFPVLDSFNDSYYKPNWQNLNNALYTNRAIYTPELLFENRTTGEVLKADVLTCASPNWRTAGVYKRVSKSENNRVLRERARWMNQVLANEGVETFIAGAWGCGVFRQDPELVATVFLEELTYPKELIFAIPPGRNYDAFKKIFER